MSDGLDPEGLLRAFAAAGLRYVLVGGLAVNAHGVIRSTNDVDICPAPDPENLARLAALLRELGATQLGVGDFDAVEMPFDPTKVEDLSRGGNFRLNTRLGALDVMQWLSGVPGDHAYPALAADAMPVELEGLRVMVCSLARLRDMKRAAGRPRDLQDLADLAIAHGDES